MQQTVLSIKEITQESVRDWFRYDDETGYLYWRKHTWQRMVGAEAGTIAPLNMYGKSYKVVGFAGKTISIHKLIWVYHKGHLPDGVQIDHEDGNSLNNRIDNLRLAPCGDNNRNSPLRTDNTSGVAGVSYVNKRWRACIGKDGKSIFLGVFDKKDDAIKARRDAELSLNYHKNHGKQKKT